MAVRAAGREGPQSTVQGEYREIVPGERIVSAQRDDAIQGTCESTVLFTKVDGRTRLTLLIEFANPQAREAALDARLEIVLGEQLQLLERVAVSLR